MAGSLLIIELYLQDSVSTQDCLFMNSVIKLFIEMNHYLKLSLNTSEKYKNRGCHNSTPTIIENEMQPLPLILPIFLF